MGNQKLPDAFSKEQLVSLAKVMDRPRMMIALLLGFICGLRAGEVVRLKKSDIDLARKEIKVVNSKNPNRSKENYGKDRFVPILHDGFIPILKKYMDGTESEWLFAPKFNKSTNNHLDRSTFDEYFHEYMDRAGLLIPVEKMKNGRTKYKYRFHTLRHSSATFLNDEGMKLGYLQKFLGHKRIETTTIYTHISTKKIQRQNNGIFENRPQIRERTEFNPFGNKSGSIFVEFEKMKDEINKLKMEQQRHQLVGGQNDS